MPTDETVTKKEVYKLQVGVYALPERLAVALGSVPEGCDCTYAGIHSSTLCLTFERKVAMPEVN
jgi:hypothetical protein